MPQRKQTAKQGKHTRKRKTQQQQERKQKKTKDCAKETQRATGVVTANENDGWHRGRAILSAANEDEEHIEFNNDHVKHYMNEDTKK